MNVKDAAWHTAHDYGFEELASRMGIKSAQVLRNKVNPNCDTHHLHIDQAVTMMSLTGDFRIAEAMAGELGCVFVQVPTHDITSENVLGLILEATSKNGDICQAFHRAMADGVITPNEEAEMLSIINQLQSHLYKLSECIKKTKS